MSEGTKISAKKIETKQTSLASKLKKRKSSRPLKSPVNQILHLQRTIGNQAVQRLFKSGLIQAKLKINKKSATPHNTNGLWVPGSTKRRSILTQPAAKAVNKNGKIGAA